VWSFVGLFLSCRALCCSCCVFVCVTCFRHGDTVGISEAPLRYPHPVVGRASVGARASCFSSHRTRVCSARRGCHLCDVEQSTWSPRDLPRSSAYVVTWFSAYRRLSLSCRVLCGVVLVVCLCV